ncbi:gfo/Idh/MocA family oxidoreductase [Prevotella sp. oral taxon 376]|uniref:Gfo/Idh/MocA family protein n=1 Tax=Prevotella sp. oral taxon 376 TaxID=712466 RepID=UPI000D1EA674|nr:Gfo/Idh/MocA family oxidoreductase [Prevotella sp. oral taxon 376]PTL34402.1 gfo/Idh/MocA family oxidoreductase [Prevotella sp. oral taxon 376]
MGYLEHIIGRYKSMRSMRELGHIYTRQYALVGFGNHCVSNLLPVMQYLQLPLKYVCCTSEKKARLISQKYKGVKGTTSLQDILNDDMVSGVFVAAHPHSHFQIASEVIKAGKSLFIEKPPCKDEDELKSLVDTVKLYGSKHIMVGLQRRFAPATQILQKRLRNDGKRHYLYRYLTGLYPEGNALLDLFIHPLDYAVFLFGKAKVKMVDTISSKDGGQTLFLMLEHQDVTGMLELSTGYSWQDAQEQLSISTDKGLYILDRMEKLDFSPRHSSMFGIPWEKVFRNNAAVINLYGRNGFVPTVGNNQSVSQGFFSEIKTFADMVENRCKNENVFGLESVKSTYSLLSEIEADISKI